MKTWLEIPGAVIRACWSEHDKDFECVLRGKIKGAKRVIETRAKIISHQPAYTIIKAIMNPDGICEVGSPGEAELRKRFPDCKQVSEMASRGF